MRADIKSQLLSRLSAMRIGGPTADGRVHLNGSLSSEEWITLQDILTDEMGARRMWYCRTSDLLRNRRPAVCLPNDDRCGWVWIVKEADDE